MGSKYTPELTVPPGFADILEDFTREVLRKQIDSPAELYQFGAEYFRDKQNQKPSIDAPDDAEK